LSRAIAKVLAETRAPITGSIVRLRAARRGEVAKRNDSACERAGSLQTMVDADLDTGLQIQ